MSLPHNIRRLRDGRLVHGELSTVFPDWTADERWLIISPHDDDPPLAGGLLLAAAARTGIPVRIRIVTDGRMGYTPHVSAADVVARRREEARTSFTLLGVEDLGWYDYPDTRLHSWQGRIPADTVADPPHVVAGFTGIQNSVVAELREYRPTRIFVLSSNDYHPDHKVVHQETMMCIFHAQGDIWPELGPPIAERPWVHELAAYRPFLSDPDICLRGDDAMFQEKLDAIAAFASQTQIAQLVASVRRAGAVEYLRSYRFETYDPAVYASLFDGDE
ncbi:MAG: PIG-L family deacetylase [Spirochaeta sp.]|jgi:LmbE family N-acetylglucosaminyl deacetylase|nr:PIG-L family deacetylase [Spirochaeta sp.]